MEVRGQRVAVVVAHQQPERTDQQARVATEVLGARYSLATRMPVVVAGAAMEPGQLVEPAVVVMGVAAHKTISGRREPQIPAVVVVGRILVLVLAGLVGLA